MSRTAKFTIEFSVDDTHDDYPASSTDAADKLLDFLASTDDWPTWVNSVDGVDPARLEMWR